MKRVRSCLLIVTAVALSMGPITPTAYAYCPDGLLGLGDPGTWSIQIKGTYYDGASSTKVLCDSRLGDQFIVSSCFTCSSPPSLGLEFGTVGPECQPVADIRNAFATGWVWGSEVQVVKNGVTRNQCVFHGATDAGTSHPGEYWYAHTFKSFDAAGNPTIERGILSFNTRGGDRIFIGKIMIKYPKP